MLLPETVCYAAIIAAVALFPPEVPDVPILTTDDIIDFLRCHVPPHHHSQLPQARAVATRLKQLDKAP